tara:strand:- start:227 stop:508 length:282 start_codon:yes stop_codon:yes gene_type:complete
MGCGASKPAAGAEGGPAKAAPAAIPKPDVSFEEASTVKTVDYRAEATRVFKLADVTADGKLDLDELANMTGFSKMARNLMGKADVDNSGQVGI